MWSTNHSINHWLYGSISPVICLSWWFKFMIWFTFSHNFKLLYIFKTYSTSCILLPLNSCWFVPFMSELNKASWFCWSELDFGCYHSEPAFSVLYKLWPLFYSFVPFIGFYCASLRLHASSVGRVSGVRFWELVPSRRRGGASPCLLHTILTQWDTHAGKHRVAVFN